MKYLLLISVAAAAAGCSENPLDPDRKGLLKTAYGDIDFNDPGGGPGGGGPGGGGPGGGGPGGGEVPGCGAVCDKFVDCFADQVDYDACLNECGANFTDDNKRFVIQASCQELAEALQGGGG